MLFSNLLKSTIMKKIILIIGISLMLSSCNKFLEENPTGTLTSESSITSSAGGIALATGCYRSLITCVNGGDAWGKNMACQFEYFTGKAYTQYQASILNLFENGAITGDYDYFINQWDNWYQGVRDCNLAISMIPNVTGFTDDQKSYYLGEVRTLRAFYYFNLVRYYGDVVYNTTTLTDVAQAEQPRTSLKTIYDEIIVPDLLYAVNESTLTDIKSTTGRVTKYVARAILADVYLTMAGYPYQEVNTDATKNWCTEGLWSMTDYPVNTSSAISLLKLAKEQLDVLYGQYELGTYDDLHDPDMNNLGEAIFQAQFLAGTDNNNIVPFCLPLASQISAYGDEYGTYIPSQAYHDSYNSADKRIVDRAFFFYSDTKAASKDANESPVKFTIPYIYKFYDKTAIKSTAQSSLNWTFYRYADILLMLTEVNWSLNQLGVSESSSDILKGINEVRTRAGVATYATADINLKNILAERAYELIFENKLLWDMRRTRKALKDGSGQFSALENFVGHQPTNFSYQFSIKHLLSPVSGTEISNNSKCEQNFGWLPAQD
jgi:starch-binding outer membrane protein, SusD/RagB family